MVETVCGRDEVVDPMVGSKAGLRCLVNPVSKFDVALPAFGFGRRPHELRLHFVVASFVHIPVFASQFVDRFHENIEIRVKGYCDLTLDYDTQRPLETLKHCERINPLKGAVEPMTARGRVPSHMGYFGRRGRRQGHPIPGSHKPEN